MHHPANCLSITDYTYHLPDERIAKFPLAERDRSKLLVYRNRSISTDVFSHLPDYIGKNDMLVFNNTRVIRARIEMEKETGARIEIFCLEPYEPHDYQLSFVQKYTCQWKCMVGNLKKWKSGVLKKRVTGNGGTETELQAEQIGSTGQCQLIRFTWDNGMDFGSLLDACGCTPIPPYLNRKTEEIDETRYQTLYSKHKGSVAAPTAGLHFTPQVLQQLADKGVKLNEITLHIGAGTFRPVQQSNAGQHEMHVEFFSINPDVLRNMIANNGDLTAIGTTSLRAIESTYWLGVKMLQEENEQIKTFHLEQWEAYTLPQDVPVVQSLSKVCEILESNKQNTLYASTKIMIVPGYTFRICKRLITNFHQPKSTLLLLVGAFVGEHWKEIYQYALEHDFRFLSYGDSSLLELNMGNG
ncbi:MAG: S-adenosylmethionine:tRNA ribosyltransferase-isomerase [Bacteroidales bacterium]|jgi:S-adenosylmethionine:tRNA ribosyltransferase-isomerase|nr:S-adenosylmethionine:tRNA ribosyltransferase-isomerase [Bacteroidales bacterium]